MLFRKLFLWFLLGCIGSNLTAQITIDSSDFASRGESYITVTDTFSAQETPNVEDFSGEPWDYTEMEADKFDTLKYISPENTDFSNEFPNSNLVQKSGELTFLQKEENYVGVNGYYGSQTQAIQSAVLINFDRNLLLLNFPSTYNTSFSDTATKEQLTIPYDQEAGIDSIRFDLDIYTQSKIDTFGTLITVTDTFETLREYRSTITYAHDFEVHDIVFNAWTSVDTTERDTTYTYNYLAKDENIPVLTLNTDSAGNIKDAVFKYRKELTIEPSISHVECYGEETGSIKLQVDGGMPPYSYKWASGETNDSIENLAAGSYEVTVTDDYGLSVAKSYTINQPDSLKIDAEIAHVSDTGEADGEIIVQVTGGTSPYTYQWENLDSKDSITGLSPGKYYLTVIDKNGCTKTKSFEVSYKSNTTDIKEFENKGQNHEIRLYPNPANDIVHIVWNGKPEATLYLDLLTFNGKKLLTRQINEKRTEISIKKIPPGMYFVKIYNSQAITVETSKLFIK
jgi:hypothetical protein